MGKIAEQPPVQESQLETTQPPCDGLSATIEKVFRAITLRCVLVLILSACVCLSALFWLPPFHPFGSGRSTSHNVIAPIQGSFELHKPLELITEQIEMLQYDIFEEVGLPNTQVSIISLNSSSRSNWTDIVFGILPDPSDTPIPPVVLSVLRSSLLGLVLKQFNFTWISFGQASSFGLLRFPGGITVTPLQSGSIFQKTQILFNFTLNNSISQIQDNLSQLKGQLKYGLQLRPYENVYVRVTNLVGSTLDPPVIVEASVLSDIGGPSLLPQRLKQLAETLAGSRAKNLGLDHAVFGKVKQIQLSSYLQHSLGSSPSPSPSPSPSLSPSLSPPPPPPSSSSSSSSSPSPSPPLPSPSPSPSPAPAPGDNSDLVPPVSVNPLPPQASGPSVDPPDLLPCINCYAPSPYGSPPQHAPIPIHRAPHPSPPSVSHVPSHSPRHGACSDLGISPKSSPNRHADPPAPYFLKRGGRAPSAQPPSPKLAPRLSSPVLLPSSPAPQQADRSGKAVASSPISPSPTSSVPGPCFFNIWTCGLLVAVTLHLVLQTCF